MTGSEVPAADVRELRAFDSNHGSAEIQEMSQGSATPPPAGGAPAYTTPSRTSDSDYTSDKGSTVPIQHRRQGLSARILPGDWRCEQCGINNFASRTVCLHCGAAGGSGPQSPSRDSINSQSSGNARRIAERPGDWNCPDPNCNYQFVFQRELVGDCLALNSLSFRFPMIVPPFPPRPTRSNYASRSTCHRCNAPKPETETDIDQQASGGDSPVGYQTNSYVYQMSPRSTAAPIPANAYAGYSPQGSPIPNSPTYAMPMYGTMQTGMPGSPVAYGAVRPGMPYAAAAAGPYSQPRGYNQQPIQMKKGDWICSGCGDLNFARRDRCRICGTPGGDGYHQMLAEQAARMNMAAAAAAAAASGAGAGYVSMPTSSSSGGSGGSPQSPVSPISPVPGGSPMAPQFMYRPVAMSPQGRPVMMMPMMAGAYPAYAAQPGVVQQGVYPYAWPGYNPGYAQMQMPMVTQAPMVSTGRPAN